MNEQVGADSQEVNQKEIRISSRNVEHFVAKISEPYFVSYVQSFDIFRALETFTADQFDFSTHFQDYHVFHRPAIKLSTHGRRSGGVAVLVSKRLMPFVTQIVYDWTKIYYLSHCMFHHTKARIICSLTRIVASTISKNFF